jgi:RHS repeat-associated protein
MEYGTEICQFKFSSKQRDISTGFSYHGRRFYAPHLHRWVSRDPIAVLMPYAFVGNNPMSRYDSRGLWGRDEHGRYSGEDSGWTCPLNPFSTWRHFRDLQSVQADLDRDISNCDTNAFLSHMHQMQDYFSHYKQGHRWWKFGHACASLCTDDDPDDPKKHPEEYREMLKLTDLYEVAWEQRCGALPGGPANRMR